MFLRVQCWGSAYTKIITLRKAKKQSISTVIMASLFLSSVQLLDLQYGKHCPACTEKHVEKNNYFFNFPPVCKQALSGPGIYFRDRVPFLYFQHQI